MSELFKRVAVVAGSGLASAIASVSSGPATKKRGETSQNQPTELEREVSVPNKIGVPADDVLYLDPLFDRLEAIERRLDAAARTPPPPPAVVPPPPDFSEVFTQLDDLRLGLPALIDAIVQEHLAGRKSETKAEIPDALIGEKVTLAVSARFSGLERVLQEQAASIGALNERVNQTESNMQRLVTVISRLIEGPGAVSPPVAAPPQRAAHAAASFEAHLTDAMGGEPMPGEADGTTRKPRVPASRIL